MVEQFFVKIRGRVLGPFPPERLSQMAKQGQLSRVHMISDDGTSWQKAIEFPQFFQSSIQSRQHEQSKQSSHVESESGTQTNSEASPHSAPAQEEWHYAVNDQSFGPVGKGVLIKLIEAGKVSKSDMVWKSGMDDWQSISDMPEFALHSEQGQRDGFAVDTGRNGGSAGSNSDLSECSLTIRATTGWVIFICIFLYMASASLFLLFIYGVVQAAKLKSSVLVAQSIIALVQCIVVATAAVFLNRYASAAGKFALTKNVANLNLSMRWLGRFWLFLSIVLIVWLVFIIIMIIYAFTLEEVLF